MRLAPWLAILLAVAGCSSSGGEGSPSDGDVADDPGSFDDIAQPPTATTGIILGVVVDTGIRPIAGATVLLHAQPEQTTTTTADGRFAFDELPPGTYFVTASALNYEESQVSADVVAGDPDPRILRIQLRALYSQGAFTVPHDFEGFVECGYQVGGVTSQCLNDYTTLVVPGGYCTQWPPPPAPPCVQVRNLLDSRGYVYAIEAGWQTIVYELTWTPTAQGTSPEMFVLSSFYNRTASNWYGQEGGEPPFVLLRLEVGEDHSSSSGDVLEPEGRSDVYAYGGIQGSPVAIGLEQRFHIYQHTFYYGKPPEDWSFMEGDKPPF